MTMNYSAQTYEQGSTRIMELLGKFPQGVTPKSVREHTGWERTKASKILAEMAKDGILVCSETPNPIRGQYPRRFTIYSLATPPPDKVKPRPPKVEAPLTPTPEVVEREALIAKGRQLLDSHPLAAALTGHWRASREAYPPSRQLPHLGSHADPSEQWDQQEDHPHQPA